MQATKLNVRQFVNVCLALTRQCADLIKEVHESGDLKKQMKGHNDPVTEADFKSQFVIQHGLLKRWPGLKFVGEESESNLIPTPFDFDGVNAHCDIPELEFLDKEFDIEDLVAYVDPLDGTISFTKGELHAVTTLIGLAHKGKPLAGVMGQIWSHIDQSFRPTVYVGMAGHSRVVSIFTDAINQYRVREVKTKINHATPEDYAWKIACSKNHYDEKVEGFLSTFGKVEKMRVSGMGGKFIACIEEIIDGHVQNLSGHSRWDILPGQVMLEALGGRCTGLHGTDYTYDGKKENAVNLDGLFFMTNSSKHAEVIPHFIKILSESSQQ